MKQKQQQLYIYIDVLKSEVWTGTDYGKLKYLDKYNGRWELSKILSKFALVGDGITPHNATI